MNTYEELSRTVQIDHNNRLLKYDESSLIHVGTGRSAFVFKIKSTMKAMKVFFPACSHIAKEEAGIYGELQDIVYYPSVYASGVNFIVIDFIEGLTLFDCIVQGKVIERTHIAEIDHALSLATARGLNPSDIHLRNILITIDNDVKIIDVARFRQKKDCQQWDNLKRAYRQFYCKRFFPKEIPAVFLNTIAWLYKKDWIPLYRART
ncbi:protein kinase family protein [Sporosarcina sp. Marseille-Q4943]|uniref:protein kinase family protein n=1 Tax=Sporosarcina sp. Marseille-Q4943 TaxID=2942204 RepID=UPI00208DAE43|nr:protein kinase family protein [Sporosarcina sp. Marseille-Q4943]